MLDLRLLPPRVDENSRSAIPPLPLVHSGTKNDGGLLASEHSEHSSITLNLNRGSPSFGPLLFRNLSAPFPRRALQDLGQGKRHF